MAAKRVPVGATSALVDEADYEAVAGLRWHLVGGYAVHSRRVGPRREGRVEKVWMHRLIARPPEGMEIDHVNGDRLDNRRANLRVVSHSENMRNRHYGYGTSQHRGVSRRANGRWLAQAGLHGKKHHIGVFDDESEAAAAVSAWWASQ
jgi:hypothetical protein